MTSQTFLGAPRSASDTFGCSEDVFDIGFGECVAFSPEVRLHLFSALTPDKRGCDAMRWDGWFRGPRCRRLPVAGTSGGPRRAAPCRTPDSRSRGPARRRTWGIVDETGSRKASPTTHQCPARLNWNALNPLNPQVYYTSLETPNALPERPQRTLNISEQPYHGSATPAAAEPTYGHDAGHKSTVTKLVAIRSSRWRVRHSKFARLSFAGMSCHALSDYHQKTPAEPDCW